MQTFHADLLQKLRHAELLREAENWRAGRAATIHADGPNLIQRVRLILPRRRAPIGRIKCTASVQQRTA